jgi:hypothetical protein
MESTASPVSALRSRSTELPGAHDPAVEEESAADAAENSTPVAVSGALAGASSKSQEPLPASLLATDKKEKPETAEALSEVLPALTAVLPSIGDEPLTTSTLQRRVPTLRQTYRNTAPSHPTVEHLSANGLPNSAQDEATATSKAAPESIPENAGPEANKRGTPP